jgi:hypothetical protein
MDLLSRRFRLNWLARESSKGLSFEPLQHSLQTDKLRRPMTMLRRPPSPLKVRISQNVHGLYEISTALVKPLFETGWDETICFELNF